MRGVKVVDTKIPRDGERRPVPPPHVRLQERFPKHPEREPADEAGRLSLRDELEGRDETAIGMTPAHERLDSGEASGRHVDHRLEVKDELVFRDRALQLETLHSRPSQSVPFFGTSR